MADSDEALMLTEASYYSIHVDGRTAQHAVWSYEQRPEAVAGIAGYLAFYPDRVDSIKNLSEGEL